MYVIYPMYEHHEALPMFYTGYTVILNSYYLTGKVSNFKFYSKKNSGTNKLEAKQSSFQKARRKNEASFEMTSLDGKVAMK